MIAARHGVTDEIEVGTHHLAFAIDCRDEHRRERQ